MTATPGQAALARRWRETAGELEEGRFSSSPGNVAEAETLRECARQLDALAAQEPHAPDETPPHHPPEWAASAEETAYEAFTARRGTSRIAWEALDHAERADWRAVPRALAKRDAAAPAQPAPELAAAMREARGYREALQVIAGYAAGTATKQMIGTAARRALEGK